MEQIKFEIIKFRNLSESEAPIGTRRDEFLSIVLRNKSIQQERISKSLSYATMNIFDVLYVDWKSRAGLPKLDFLFRRGGVNDIRLFFTTSGWLYKSRIAKRLTRSQAINNLVNCHDIFWINPIIHDPDNYITICREIMVPSKLLPESLKLVLL